MDKNKIIYNRLLNKYGNKNYNHQIDNYLEILRDVNLKKEKTVLEIGAGNGLFSHFLAIYFDAKVTSLDQYEGFGSVKETYNINKSLSEQLNYNNVEIIKSDIATFETERKYDYIFAINVFHHIIETHKKLSHDNENFDNCMQIFSTVHNLLNENGTFLLREVGKLNYPFNPLYLKERHVVNFKTKQDSSEWVKCLKEAGFKDIKIRYVTPRYIRKVPGSKFVFDNRLISAFFDSAYVITSRKSQSVI